MPSASFQENLKENQRAIKLMLLHCFFIVYWIFYFLRNRGIISDLTLIWSLVVFHSPGWSENRFTVVSACNSEFILVLLFITVHFPYKQM